jgi:hypothetical protein
MTRDLATALLLAAMTTALFVIFKLATWVLATLFTAAEVIVA